MQVSPTQEKLQDTINEVENVLNLATLEDMTADNAQVIADLFEKFENLTVNKMVTAIISI